jgi:predicted dehydrogenase
MSQFMSEKLRIAVVGLTFGNTFMPAFTAHPNVAEVGVCDTNADTLGKVGDRYGIPGARRHPSLEHVLESRKYDAVALFTPIPDHAAHCIAVLEAGLHCACAVPMATTLQDIRRVSEVRRRTGKTYMMMETSLYTPEFLLVQDLYRAGEFGEIQFMRGVWHNNLENHPRYWQGLPPMHYITHPMSPMLKLAGRRVADVACFGSGDMREPLKAVYGNPYPVQTAIFQLGPDPISAKVEPVGRIDRPLTVEVTSIAIETAVQSKETFDLWGTKQSFTWASFHDDKHALIRMWAAKEGGPKGSPSAVFRFDAPSAHDRLPRELQWVSPRQPKPHLVHEFVRAVIEGRESDIDVEEAAAYCEPGIRAHAAAMRLKY